MPINSDQETTTMQSPSAISILTPITDGLKTILESTSNPKPLDDRKHQVTMASIKFEEPSFMPKKQTVEELSNSLQHFGVIDYAVFILMLIVCTVIGYYFGFVDKKRKDHKKERRGSEALDYLVGGRKMKVFPVSLSLVASFISGISLLGTSTEIYVYGTQYAFILITLIISGIISWYIFLPVFCNLQLTSTYEYFEMRFDKRIRLFGSTLFLVGTIVWLPIVIFVPALSFNQVTGINIHIITPIVCLVCIFYTCAGGLKAVVWTDVIQTFVMVGAIIVVIIKGTIDVGGLATVWQRNLESGRIEAPSMSLDPTVRLSILGLIVGSTFYQLQIVAGNQNIIQRFLAVPSIKEARQSLFFFITGVVLLVFACCYNGLLIHATYFNCDPLSTKLAKAKDQLVPLLVMDVLGGIPGLPGAFIAGVFSAALSSLSTGLNSMTAVILEDYIKPMRKSPLSEQQTAIIMRSLVVVIGLICVGLVYVVEHLGAVIQLSMTLGSISSGPLLSLFLMGLLMPWINGKSALFGSICSFCIMTVICVKGRIAIASGELYYDEKPVTTIGCQYAFEAVNTSHIANIYEGPKTWWDYVFHMSFYLYVFVGLCVSVLFANLSSLYFGQNDASAVSPELLAPFMRKYFNSKDYKIVNVKERESDAPMNGLNQKDG